MTKSGPWLSSKPSLGNSVDCILAVLNNSSAEEVVGKPTAFPEFGVDIVLHHKHGTILVFYTFSCEFLRNFWPLLKDTFCLIWYLWHFIAILIGLIFTLILPYVVPVKSKVKISQNLVAFSEYMNFTTKSLLMQDWVFRLGFWLFYTYQIQ